LKSNVVVVNHLLEIFFMLKKSRK